MNTEISATTKGKADGGVIRIHSDRIDFSRVNINSESTDKRLSVIGGDSGVIEIKSKDLTFGEGVSVSTATLGLGKAGLIDIQSDTIKMEGGDSHLKGVSITGNTRLRDESGKIGDLVGGIGGSINLRGKSIHLGGNVMISSETWGNGSAGELKIESGELELTDGAQVSVNSGFALIQSMQEECVCNRKWRRITHRYGAAEFGQRSQFIGSEYCFRAGRGDQIKSR